MKSRNLLKSLSFPTTAFPQAYPRLVVWEIESDPLHSFISQFAVFPTVEEKHSWRMLGFWGWKLRNGSPLDSNAQLLCMKVANWLNVNTSVPNCDISNCFLDSAPSFSKNQDTNIAFPVLIVSALLLLWISFHSSKISTYWLLVC